MEYVIAWFFIGLFTFGLLLLGALMFGKSTHDDRAEVGKRDRWFHL